MNYKSENSGINRRFLLRGGAGLLFAGLLFRPKVVWAKEYLTPDQARKLIWGDKAFAAHPVTLTKPQMKSIKKASKTRVRNKKLNAFKSAENDWFLLDQVVGKHEFIDIGVGIDGLGKVKGIEILEYRETYGYEIANPKWRAQFTGRDSSEHLKLDKQVKNISGATLSCRHITDAINRLTHTWDQVLKPL
ncbi:MAG: FMN-binding protein [Kordiimonadaceae bacterium]|nr:FMN-binding protein [Kordiimonadaceae bacterium]